MRKFSNDVSLRNNHFYINKIIIIKYYYFSFIFYFIFIHFVIFFIFLCAFAEQTGFNMVNNVENKEHVSVTDPQFALRLECCIDTEFGE